MVGLDWPVPMIFFLLHVTRSCIFHAYVPFFFILLILNVLVLFCLSLSLSYYFDWKSTLSRNPLRSKASSSSPLANSTPSHIRIHDDKARKEFSKNFSRCGIHSEHQVILLDFSDTNLSIVIYSRGWESLCGISVTCPSMII